jgi:hypothetical protein
MRGRASRGWTRSPRLQRTRSMDEDGDLGDGDRQPSDMVWGPRPREVDNEWIP